MSGFNIFWNWWFNWHDTIIYLLTKYIYKQLWRIIMVTAQRTAKNTATLNIEAMLEREAERQDDLREAESKRISGILEAKAEYLEQMRKADKEAIALARTSDREAIAIAREDVDRRLEEMNLMRQQI